MNKQAALQPGKWPILPTAAAAERPDASGTFRMSGHSKTHSSTGGDQVVAACVSPCAKHNSVWTDCFTAANIG